MAGDLSLSQSLGGLRIANPDSEDLAASPSPPPQSQYDPPNARRTLHASQSSTSTIQAVQPPTVAYKSSEQEQGLGFDPSSYTLREEATPQLTHRSSGVLNQKAHSQAAAAASSALYSSQQNASRRPPQAGSIRPNSAMYNLQNTSSSSAISQQNSYGYRSDLASSSYGSNSELSRTGSRSSRQPSDRIYRQVSQNIGASGPLPPRRNSRRSRAPTGASDASDLYPTTSEEWRDRGAAVGTKLETDASGQTVLKTVKKGVKDFNFGHTLGEGSYSTVLAATDRQTGKDYAIKVLDKRHIIKEKKVKYVNIERDTLNRLTEHPGVVRLYYTFQDERSLYFVLDLASGGELLGVLKKLGSFDIECTKYYAAQILDSIAYMHSRGVIHRDLKPENVLLDREMHVKITDFGTAKILKQPQKSNGDAPDAIKGLTDREADRAVSFVGTAEYVSPELLRDKSACKASDLWAFGCILFQLLAGRPPFKAANEYLTFQKILGLEYIFPDSFPEHARDLVERLLVLDPAARLTIDHIKSHPFFDGVTWGKGLWKQKAPRLKAYVPPPAPPIKLNGTTNEAGQGKGQPRPQLRNITDLPPPSQLDIDWSAVLTHQNERILKLGNLIVGISAQPVDTVEALPPTEKPKFSRFFSGNAGKRRERLVLVTSAARIIIATAGGNEKKAKMDLYFSGLECSWKDFVDARGLTGWTIAIVSSAVCLLVAPALTQQQRDKYYTFEDPSATTSDPAGSKYSTKEWLESLEHAKEFFYANQRQSATNSYSGNSLLNGYDSQDITSPSDSIGGDIATPLNGPQSNPHHLRQTLRRDPSDPGSLGQGRKRFSKRHSKSGLAAVF